MAAAERELDTVIRESLGKAPGRDEVERAKTRLFAAQARGQERLGGFGGRSDVLAESTTFGGNPEAYLERLRRLGAATPESVRAAGKAWLEQPSYTLIVEPGVARSVTVATRRRIETSSRSTSSLRRASIEVPPSAT